MHSKPRPLLLTFVIVHLSFVILIAAPPPELTVLRQQYDKVVAERVTTVFDASKAALDAKFTTALDNAIATAKASGDLPTVLAIQEDKKAIEAKQDLPADTDTTPTALKTLRAIYREQVSKLTEQRTANTAALLAPYAAKLQQLEANLTKNDRVEEAKEVMDYRVSLKADAPSAPVVTTAPPTSTPDTTAQPARAFPQADERKAVEWALNMNVEFLRVKANEKVITIKKLEELPAEGFHIIMMRFNQQTAPKTPYKGLEILAGLPMLEQLELVNMPVPDDDVEVFATLPKLRQLLIDQNKARFTGSRLDLLAPLQNLQSLNLRLNKGIGTPGITAISKLPGLKNLNLVAADVDDKDLPLLAGMTSLESLDLGRTKTTSKAIASALKPLSNLSSFGWQPSAKKAAKEFPEIAATFPDITTFYLYGEGDLSQEDAEALTAFSRLERVYTEYGSATDNVVAGLAAHPTINYLRIYYTDKLTDKPFAALAKSPSLGTLSFDAAQITDEALTQIAKLTSLKRLGLSRCKKLTEAGIEAFMKARPDVTVLK